MIVPPNSHNQLRAPKESRRIEIGQLRPIRREHPLVLSDEPNAQLDLGRSIDQNFSRMGNATLLARESRSSVFELAFEIFRTIAIFIQISSGHSLIIELFFIKIFMTV